MSQQLNNLTLSRTVVRNGYRYSLTNAAGQEVASRETAREYSHVVVSPARTSLAVNVNYCGRLDLAQKQAAVVGVTAVVVALSATNEAAAPKKEAQLQLAFIDYVAQPLVVEETVVAQAWQAIGADNKEYQQARNTKGRSQELLAAYWEAKKTKPSAYRWHTLAQYGLADGMLIQLATTYRGVINPVFMVEPATTVSDSTVSLVMMKAPGQPTKIVVEAYNLSRWLGTAVELLPPAAPAPEPEPSEPTIATEDPEPQQELVVLTEELAAAGLVNVTTSPQPLPADTLQQLVAKAEATQQQAKELALAGAVFNGPDGIVDIASAGGQAQEDNALHNYWLSLSQACLGKDPELGASCLSAQDQLAEIIAWAQDLLPGHIVLYERVADSQQAAIGWVGRCQHIARPRNAEPYLYTAWGMVATQGQYLLAMPGYGTYLAYDKNIYTQAPGLARLSLGPGHCQSCCLPAYHCHCWLDN